MRRKYQHAFAKSDVEELAPSRSQSSLTKLNVYNA